jgi:DNA-directed RNA polymerase subunit RPC12/RpoP
MYAAGRTGFGIEFDRKLHPYRVPAVRLNVKERTLPAENSEQVIETVAEKKADKGQQVQCPRCGSDYMKRIRGTGFLQARVCSIFGYYPWRCTKCLGNFLIKIRGESKRHQELVPDTE